jgi:ligand-binding sensor domain-containing protein/serine phosphatase RsbU (regulator of sigma subunit)
VTRRAHWSLGILVTGLCAPGAAIAAPGRQTGDGAASSTPGLPGPELVRVTVAAGEVRHAVHFDNLFTRDGLPTGQTTAIAQDAAGFLWFGTQRGLVRFDGRKVEVLSASSGPGGLSNNVITALALGADGALWVGTAEGGLNRIDGTTGHVLQFRHRPDRKDSLSDDHIMTLHAPARSRRLWIGTAEGGLNRLDFDTGRITRYPAPRGTSGTSVACLLEDRRGRLWMGTDAGIAMLPPGGAVPAIFQLPTSEEDALRALHFLSGTVLAIHEDPDGNLWFGSDGGGLARLAPGLDATRFYRHDPQSVHSLHDDHVFEIIEDDQASLWLATNNGVARFVPDSELSLGFSPVDRQDLSYHYLSALFQDREGSLWLGMHARGLSWFHPSRVDYGYYRVRGVSTSFHEDDEGNVWIGTNGGGLSRLRLDTGESVHYTADAAQLGAPLESHWITSIQPAPDRSLWLGTMGLGLLRFYPATGELRSYRKRLAALGLQADEMFTLHQFADQSLCLGTWGSGLVCLDRDLSRAEVFRSAPQDPTTIAGDFLYTVVPDRNLPDVLWIGASQAGLSRFDRRQGKFTRYTAAANQPQRLSHGSVVSIHQDPDGILWLGTYGGGLDRLDPRTGTIDRPSADPRLATLEILGVLAGADDHLWLTTDGAGLVRLDRQGRHVTFLDEADGVQDREFTQGAVHAGASGTLYVGGAQGFNAFDPRELRTRSGNPPIVLTRMQVMDQPRPVLGTGANQVSLGYRDAMISFEFVALSFLAPQRTSYAVQVVGLHDRWIEIGTRNSMSFGSLPAGDYVFRVKARTPHGDWTPAALNIPIRVAPPPWRSSWAYALYTLGLVAMALVYQRAQRARLDRLHQQERLRAMEQEMDLVVAAQSMFLPSDRSYRSERVAMAGFYRPADRCGGDWWWHEHGAGGKHLFLVGDVTGHGAGPAVFTAAVASRFRSHPADIPDRMQSVCQQIRETGGHYHMTMTALELDEQTGELWYYNAGGVPVFCGQKGRVSVLCVQGTTLGAQELQIGRTQRTLQAGDRILLLTDGLPEAETPDGRPVGYRNLRRIFEQSLDREVEEAASWIAGEVDRMTGSGRQSDDITLVLVEWRGQSPDPVAGERVT